MTFPFGLRILDLVVSYVSFGLRDIPIMSFRDISIYVSLLSSLTFSMFPLHTNHVFTFALFSDSAVPSALSYCFLAYVSQFPLLSRSDYSEHLVYIFLKLVLDTSELILLVSPRTFLGSPECQIPTRLRPSSSPLFDSCISGMRSGEGSR